MMIFEAPVRTMPVNLGPFMAAEIATSRCRTLIQPIKRYRAVSAGDALWVREAITILDRQPRRDEIALTYAGSARKQRMPWPAAFARPGAGHRPADAMPIHVSRYTLMVDQVEHFRLAQVSEETALGAGLRLEGEGYGVHGFDFLKPFEDHVEALGFMHDALIEKRAEPNPDVAVIHFRAVARNIAQVMTRSPGRPR